MSRAVTRRIVRLAALALGAAACATATGNAVAPATLAGCWRATPPLTYSATGGPERGDSSWAFLLLERNGRASRPLVAPGRDAMSTWRLSLDTLVVVLGDGMVGWRLHLRDEGTRWGGTGEYVTDVVQPGVRAPVRRRVELVRVGARCPGGA